jgi:hypothetical protein
LSACLEGNHGVPALQQVYDGRHITFAPIWCEYCSCRPAVLGANRTIRRMRCHIEGDRCCVPCGSRGTDGASFSA